MKCIAIVALVLFACHARAQPIGSPAPPPQTQYAQHIGARLPLTARLHDENDREIPLGRYFSRMPVVIVFGYFHCPNLCQTVMEGVLQVLSAVSLDHRDYQVLMVSIDARETTALAREKKQRYLAADGGSRENLHLLTGSGAAAIARAAGFHYRYDETLDQYMHPAGFLVADPGGRITRYFLGVRYAVRDVRLALVEAAQGTLGTPADRLLLLCSHYDPAAGRYSVQVMAVVRTVALVLLAVLAGWMWLHRRHGLRR